MKNLICPISDEKIDEQVTRLNALFVILFVVAGILFDSVWFMLFITIDFFLRAFSFSKFSPVRCASVALAKLLMLPKKPIDKAPKIFAARLGFLMAFVISILFLLQLPSSALVFASILIFFATLEMVFKICIGCHIYAYVVYPFYRGKP